MTSPYYIPINIDYDIKIPTNLDKKLEIQYTSQINLSENERLIILRKDKLLKKEKIIPPLQDRINPNKEYDDESIVDSFHSDDVEFI